MNPEATNTAPSYNYPIYSSNNTQEGQLRTVSPVDYEDAIMSNSHERLHPSSKSLPIHQGLAQQQQQDNNDNHHNQDGPCLVRSKSIPIRNDFKRTSSELQLAEDQQVADFRDYLMFTRIVDGITRQQQENKDFRSRLVNDACLAHIIGVRNLSEDELGRCQFDHDAPPSYAVNDNSCAQYYQPQQLVQPQQQQHCMANMPTRTSLEPMSLRMFLEQSYNEVQRDDEMFMLEL